jgi:ubiquinone biosynthesis protein COQ9
MAQPSKVPPSLQELALLADEIIYLAGDKSVDPSWYTKRGSLSAVYAASELFMTNDSSTGFTETRGFLRRRLDESSKTASVLSSVSQWVGYTATAGINVMRSKGARI